MECCRTNDLFLQMSYGKLILKYGIKIVQMFHQWHVDPPGDYFTTNKQTNKQNAMFCISVPSDPVLHLCHIRLLTWVWIPEKLTMYIWEVSDLLIWEYLTYLYFFTEAVFMEAVCQTMPKIMNHCSVNIASAQWAWPPFPFPCCVNNHGALAVLVIHTAYKQYAKFMIWS